MSKEKPEVGDVWGIDEYVTRVLFVSENAVRFIYPNFIGPHPVILVWNIEDFVGAYKYLGKSKVSIEELFDVIPELTAKDVTKLMDITGCGMLACKHALIKFKGNSELALDYLMGGWND